MSESPTTLSFPSAAAVRVHRLVGHVPDRWEQWNKAVRGAYLKGAQAAHDGNKHCPYVDRRTDRGAVTFSRGFIRAWEGGQDDALRHLAHK